MRDDEEASFTVQAIKVHQEVALCQEIYSITDHQVMLWMQTAL